jgi:threonine/homoserine/homoserine lactone efflux protein
VLVSVLLGGLIIAIGLRFRSSVEHAQDAIVGGLLIATGVVFTVLELAGRGHARGHEDQHSRRHPEHGRFDDHRPEDHGHPPRPRVSRLGGLVAIMVPFGAAASPDLTVLPVFLAAAATGAATAIGSVVAFALATVSAIVALTILATLSGYQVRGRWLDRWGNLVSAGVLLGIGALILAGMI